MTRARAYAKVNLALVVGPLRPDGKHEVATVLEALELHDDIALEVSPELAVEGFPDDSLVRAALASLAAAARVEPEWRVRIEKRIPVAAGLGGGSSDAAAALRLANATLAEPLPPAELHTIAVAAGADVPFFLRRPPQLGTGDGTHLVDLVLPRDYAVVVALPAAPIKDSTASVYAAFDARSGAEGFAERRAALEASLASVRHARDLAGLPSNDLASSPLADELLRLGAFRADVTGAGPAVYGLFEREDDAERVASQLRDSSAVWVTRPARAV